MIYLKSFNLDWSTSRGKLERSSLFAIAHAIRFGLNSKTNVHGSKHKVTGSLVKSRLLQSLR